MIKNYLPKLLLLLCLFLPFAAFPVYSQVVEIAQPTRSQVDSIEDFRTQKDKLEKESLVKGQLLSQKVEEQLEALEDSAKQIEKHAAGSWEKAGSLSFLGRSTFELISDQSVVASLQVVRVLVGEPSSFNVPLYIYFTPPIKPKSDTTNTRTATELLNPIGGVLSVTLQPTVATLLKSHSSLTKLELKSNIGLRYLTGEDTVSNESRQFLAPVLSLYLFLETSAWLAGDNISGGGGKFWVDGGINFSPAQGEDFKAIFGETRSTDIWVLSLRGGLSIGKKVNIGISFLKQFTHADKIDLYHRKIIKVTTDFDF